jgi:spore photoproduct lyase
MKFTNFKDGKKEMHRISKKGTSMGTCATLNRKYLCCSVHVLRSVHNCPFECTYCFLQNYLTDGSTKIVDDAAHLMNEVKECLRSEPSRLFRIGTWELGDSLALEKKTGQAEKLIHAFARLDNAVLELKTKSDCVDSLLSLGHNGKTVISWSLNTRDIITSEEHKTAPLDKRIAAIQKAAGAGYLIGLHFDPMIFYDRWEEGYMELVSEVFNALPVDRIAWISIGSLRFNPEMKKKIENNYPDSRLTSAEMVLGDDAKIRYVKPLRVEMYRYLYNALRKYISNDTLIYLCMERWDVWDKVFGSHPESVEHLDYLFAKSLYERFGLGAGQPTKECYMRNA